MKLTTAGRLAAMVLVASLTAPDADASLTRWDVCAILKGQQPGYHSEPTEVTGIYIPDYTEPSIKLNHCGNYEISAYYSKSNGDQSVERFDAAVYDRSDSVERNKKYYVTVIAKIIVNEQSPNHSSAFIERVSIFHPTT